MHFVTSVEEDWFLLIIFFSDEIDVPVSWHPVGQVRFYAYFMYKASRLSINLVKD